MMSTKDHRPAFHLLQGKSPKELLGELPTPCYIVDESGLQKNGERLAAVIKKHRL